jgi:hypothetical protein
MKNKYQGLLKGDAWILLACLMLLTLPLIGCGNKDLQTEVQTLTKEKTELQAQVQNLTQEKAALQKLVDNPQSALKIDYLDTASSVTTINGQADWHEYVAQKSFTAGSQDGLWVMFGFSNMLHNRKVNVIADIYIISNGQVVASRNNDAALNDSTYGNLYWGDTFDISTYAAGDYTVLLTINDIIAGTSATQKTTFNIGTEL